MVISYETVMKHVVSWEWAVDHYVCGCRKANAECYPTTFSQLVANDVDHNVYPLDDYGPFLQNGGGESFQHLFLCLEEKSLCQRKRIARLQQCMSAADITKNRSITNIHPSSFSSKSGLTVTMKEVCDLYKRIVLVFQQVRFIFLLFLLILINVFCVLLISLNMNDYYCNLLLNFHFLDKTPSPNYLIWISAAILDILICNFFINAKIPWKLNRVVLHKIICF